MKNTKPYLLLLSTLLSCGEIPKTKEKEKKERELVSIQLLEDDEISSKREIRKIAAGKVLTLSVRGIDYLPRFSTYSALSSSSWMKKICIAGDRHDCFYSRVKGKCLLNYRSFDGYTSEEINLSVIKNLGLNYSLGSQTQLLGANIFNDEYYKTFKRSFTKSELQQSNLLYLKNAYVDPNRLSQRTGYIGHGHCEGHGARGFRIDANTSSSIKSYPKKRSFFVDLVLEEVKL